MSWSLTFRAFGEKAIVISWPQEIDQQIRGDIDLFEQKIHKMMMHAVEETVAAYCSLTVYLKTGFCLVDVIEALRVLYHEQPDFLPKNKNLWYIPVCYDLTFAIDLMAISEAKSCERETVIKLHTAAEYRVDFLGFLPGFCYLSGLHPVLHTPRLAKPRNAVEKGSVAIGGKQTGIYPIDSPGGWHVIGRTPVTLFNPNDSPPCFISAMDKIRFYAIALDEYYAIINDGRFVCKKERLS